MAGDGVDHPVFSYPAATAKPERQVAPVRTFPLDTPESARSPSARPRYQLYPGLENALIATRYRFAPGSGGPPPIDGEAFSPLPKRRPAGPPFHDFADLFEAVDEGL